MKNRLKKAFIFLLFFCSAKTGFGKPTVCLETNMGEICIELFDETAPGTVENFLNYVNDGDYLGSIFHRSMPGFVIQGGGFTITEDIKLASIALDDPIVNEFSISNTRGTVAMAKLGGDPDSATNQWFVNLADNSENLDNQNGGFTVFGQVSEAGMQVFDNIAALPRFNFGGALTDTPTIDFDGENLNRDNFVTVNAARVLDGQMLNAAAIFKSNQLSFPVDIEGLGKFNVVLNLSASSPQWLFSLDADSVTEIAELPENFASFSLETLELIIPSINVDDQFVVSDVVLKLIDGNELIFLLTSFQQ